MKIKRSVAAVCAAVCLAAGVGSGCAGQAHTIYTNIPEGDFNISDNSYTLGGIIDGCTVSVPKEEDMNLSGYTSTGRVYFSMLASAELVVSADFSADGVTKKHEDFINEVSVVLNAIDKALSTTVVNSDISKFNNAQAGERVEISQIAYDVLSEAKAVYEFTDGYYNPALYYNIFAYGFGGATQRPSSESELPSDGLIEKYTDLASHFDEIELTESEDGYFVKKPVYTVTVDGETLSLKLDLGGIGKGYAVDKVDGLFDKYGFGYGYFNFGSSSMLVKSNLLNGAYNIGFAGPRSPSREPYVKTTVQNEKLSTSGDDEQFYRIGDKRYCHIIDPTTGKPVQTGIMSVTVIGGSAAQDDALTTAIMAMGKERAIKFIEEKLTDRRVVFTCE